MDIPRAHSEPLGYCFYGWKISCFSLSFLCFDSKFNWSLLCLMFFLLHSHFHDLLFIKPTKSVVGNERCIHTGDINYSVEVPGCQQLGLVFGFVDISRFPLNSSCWLKFIPVPNLWVELPEESPEGFIWCGTWWHGLAYVMMLGYRLKLMILEISSSLGDSVFLVLFCPATP